MEKKRIAIVTASPMTVKAFLQGHIRAWAKSCHITVFVNAVSPTVFEEENLPVAVWPIRIERQISPLFDLWALLSLIRQLRHGQFDAVISVTPKAGLIAMLSAFASCTPVRMHIFTGQVWATRKGLSRMLLKCLDKLTANMATDVLVDSESQRQFLIEEGVVSPQHSVVLAHGSISGVDVKRFKPDSIARREIRAELKIDESDVLLLFLGRLNSDKGVLDLGEAFAHLASKYERVQILFVGPDEGGMRTQLRLCCEPFIGRVHFIDYTDRPERYMAAADVFCLPSYREGFGTVIIEAAAAGLPAIASRIYGLTDAVIDGQTGLLHAPHDVSALATAIAMLLDDPEMRKRLGVAGLDRACCYFSADAVTQEFAAYVGERLSLSEA